ncbi:MAG: hypothetical protein M5U27_01135 [Gaiella sp.]|nr:hypothetical protein [Gaiella sp.]
MWKLFEKERESTVSFCDRCGQVCDERCRSEALREQALLQQLRLGFRV